MRKPAAVVVVVVLLLAVGFAGHAYLAEAANRVQEQFGSRPAAALTDLRSVDQLQAAFNDAAGEPRLILLFSPT